MDIRKTVFTKEIITADEMGQACEPITRVTAMAVVKNPFADIAQTDLTALFEFGAQLGGSLTEELGRLFAMARQPLSEPPAPWNMAQPCCTRRSANPCVQLLGAAHP